MLIRWRIVVTNQGCVPQPFTLRGRPRSRRGDRRPRRRDHLRVVQDRRPDVPARRLAFAGDSGSQPRPRLLLSELVQAERLSEPIGTPPFRATRKRVSIVIEPGFVRSTRRERRSMRIGAQLVSGASRDEAEWKRLSTTWRPESSVAKGHRAPWEEDDRPRRGTTRRNTLGTRTGAAESLPGRTARAGTRCRSQSGRR